jgi:RND superfamily putative drug exporter
MTTASPRSGRLNRLGQAAVRRRRLVLVAWLAIAAATVGLGSTVGIRFADSFEVPGAEAQRVVELLATRFPAVSGAQATIVFHAATGTLRDEARAKAVAAVIADVAGQPHVIAVDDPLRADATGNTSQDGAFAFASVRFDVSNGALGAPAVDRLKEAAAAAGPASGLEVEFGGELIDFNYESRTGEAEGLGLLAAIVILVFAFGSLVAVGLPLGTAIISLLMGLSTMGLVGNLVDIPTAAPTLAAMLGLGTGIDYALFIVTRFREGLSKGLSVEKAVGQAIATSGRAVVLAGGTVVIAILGLWIAGIPLIGFLGLASAVVVAINVVAAITLLPALLGFAGRRIDRFHVPGLRRFSGHPSAESGAWTAWGQRVSGCPWRFLFLGLVILLVLSAPVLDLRLGELDDSAAPPDSTQRHAYDLLVQGFGPGFTSPLVIVAELPAGSGAGSLESLATAIGADPGVVAVTPPQINLVVDTAVFTVVPRTAGQDPLTSQLVHRLRETVLPAATTGTGIAVAVGGSTAFFIDMSERVADRLPLLIGAVLAVSFLLLTLMFRSLLVPLKAIVLNLLAIGAAYGVVVAVFQWGYGLGIVGLTETVPISSFVPMLMFAVLFGLSMDYEVFLLSRVREAYLVGADNERAVVAGIARTGRVITSAALIMISVFGAFVLDSDPLIKMFGVGLATAVLVDATIVRLVLVPATMTLLGDSNWWLPGWLSRVLPHLGLDAPP